MEFFEDPSSTREEILAAAYRGLCRHGYADLTVQKIGEEFDKSASLVYHHYDGKDELLLACLEYMLERYESQFVDESLENPRERLETAFEEILGDTDDAAFQFMRSLVELRGQAPHDERYRDHFTRSDRLFQSRLETVVAAGIEAGEFRDVDPGETAAMLETFFAGWFLRRTTVDDPEAWSDDVRAAFDDYVRTRLYVDADQGSDVDPSSDSDSDADFDSGSDSEGA